MAARCPARLLRALTILGMAMAGPLAACLAAAAACAAPPSELAPAVREVGRDVYRLTYEGNQPALVAIEAQGIESLQLRVTDTEGRNACSARREGLRLLCEWHPRATQEFVIEVRNKARGANPYRLWTN
jgi:hypothetical protein